MMFIEIKEFDYFYETERTMINLDNVVQIYPTSRDGVSDRTEFEFIGGRTEEYDVPYDEVKALIVDCQSCGYNEDEVEDETN